MDRQSDHTSAIFDHFRSANRQWMFYTGPSMNPTLRASDILHIVPYKHRRIRLGDVIVFVPSEGGRPIVHRAVSKNVRGVMTRGDNNTRVDPCVLEPSRIIGQVTFAQSGDKWRRVYGGTVGRVIGNLMNVRNLIDRRLSAVLNAKAQRQGSGAEPAKNGGHMDFVPHANKDSSVRSARRFRMASAPGTSLDRASAGWEGSLGHKATVQAFC